jgi:hypothetical protein
MYRVENSVGRLVEIAIWSPVSLDEVASWARDHDRVVGGVAGEYVCLVDLRGARVFPPPIVSAYTSAMKDESRLLRTASYLPKDAIVGLQIGRMIREAGHPGRKAFEEPEPLLLYLGEVLTKVELQRARRLVLGSPPGSGLQ